MPRRYRLPLSKVNAAQRALGAATNTATIEQAAVGRKITAGLPTRWQLLPPSTTAGPIQIPLLPNTRALLGVRLDAFSRPVVWHAL